jgi:hypothetical protein
MVLNIKPVTDIQTLTMRGVSCGVDMIRISRIPAFISTDMG